MKKIIMILMIILGAAAACNAYAYGHCYKKGTDISMPYTTAKFIALNSECTRRARLLNKHWCNEETGTWWIAIRPYKSNPMCHPACVIDIIKNTAQINWMCTGLLPSNQGLISK